MKYVEVEVEVDICQCLSEKNMFKTTLLEYYTKIQTFRLVLNQT